MAPAVSRWYTESTPNRSRRRWWRWEPRVEPAVHTPVVRAEPEPARPARTGDLRDGHTRRARRSSTACGRGQRARSRASPVEQRGRSGQRRPGRPRPLRRPHRQRRRAHPLLVVPARRPFDIRGSGGRAAPVQPGRAGAVPPHLGGRAGGRGSDSRIRGPRLRAGRARRRPSPRHRIGVSTAPVELTALPPLETAARLGRLRSAFEPAGCDVLLVTNLANVRYLTGFTGSAGMLLVRGENALLTTDGRYRTQ